MSFYNKVVMRKLVNEDMAEESSESSVVSLPEAIFKAYDDLCVDD